MPDLAIGAPSVGSQFLTYKVSHTHGFAGLFSSPNGTFLFIHMFLNSEMREKISAVAQNAIVI